MVQNRQSGQRRPSRSGRVPVQHEPAAVGGVDGPFRVGLGGQHGVDEDPLERRPVGHQPERDELGGDVVGKLVADRLGNPRPDPPMGNKEMRSLDGMHACQDHRGA